MFLFGLLIAAASGVFMGLLAAHNPAGSTAPVDLFGYHIASLSRLGDFLAGVALALIFCIGLWLMGTYRRLRQAGAHQRTVVVPAQTAPPAPAAPAQPAQPAQPAAAPPAQPAPAQPAPGPTVPAQATPRRQAPAAQQPPARPAPAPAVEPAEAERHRPIFARHRSRRP